MKTIAFEIAVRVFGHSPKRLERFKTGIAHHVYHVVYDRAYVLKIYDEDTLDDMGYWIHELKDLALPIPEIVTQGIYKNMKYFVTNFIPGYDLAYVYKSLNNSALKAIADEVVDMQRKVMTLKPHDSYGCVANYNVKGHDSWKEEVLSDLNRSRAWLERTGVYPLALVDEAIELVESYETYFETIEPKAFLADITTKNLLVDQDRVSGIVDLDWMCFGDVYYFVGLVQMALMAMKADTIYVAYLMEAFGAGDQEHKIVNLYTYTFCVVFMSEQGMTFNGNNPTLDPEHVAFLEVLHGQLKAVVIHDLEN